MFWRALHNIACTMVCVFFHSISNNIFTGINRPGVSCEYDTYPILLNMYVQVFLFASMVCCVVWSGGISSVSPVIELSYFFFYLLLCRCRCLHYFFFPWCDVCSIYLWYFGVLVYVTFFHCI